MDICAADYRSCKPVWARVCAQDIFDFHCFLRWGRAWSADEENERLELIASNIPQREIAIRMHRTSYSIHSCHGILKTQTPTLARRRYTDEEDEIILQMSSSDHNTNESMADLPRRTWCSVNAWRRALQVCECRLKQSTGQVLDS